MRQRSSIEPPPPTQFLHSTLRAVLGSLDVQLEEELARYRHQRVGRQKQARRNRHKPLDVASVGTSSASQPDLSENAIQASSAGVSAATLRQDLQQREGDSVPASAAMLAIAPDLAPDSQAVGHSQSELASINLDRETAEELTNQDNNAMGPDDYLESSEELLKSLAEEEAELRTKREPGFVESLLTPLGIGSMLLLLLSSITLGYVIMNPSSLGFLGLEDATTRELAPEVENSGGERSEIPNTPNLATEEFRDLNLDTLSTLPTGPTGSNTTSTPSIATSVPSTPAETIPSPAAAPELAVPAQSSQVQPRATRVTVPAQSPQRSQPRSTEVAPRRTQPTRARPTAVRPAPAPPVQSAPVRPVSPPPAPVLEPAPVVTAPALPSPSSPAAVSASSESDYYRVVGGYSGDRSLEQAQEAVPDAYVRNSPAGAQIQLGAFNDEAGAEELVRELEQQGIPAQVYEP